jgi:hypothetical protein
MLPTTIDVSLPEIACLGDHAISGKAIVPAVELLDFLLHVLRQQGVDVATPLTMRDVVFPRFLAADEIPRCTFAVTLTAAEGNAVRAVFESRIALPNGIERKRTHAEVTIGGEVASPPLPGETAADFEVSAEQVYRELVRFGPHFCNLRGTLRLARTGGWGTVESPAPPHANPSAAGCPYLLDSAMHLACVWGQRYAGIVAYPTGFASRKAPSPIASGRRRCAVVPRTVEPRRLTFDLWLSDDEGQVCDAIAGLVMVPLATGAPPPAWIVA